jgi:hypothetical protein
VNLDDAQLQHPGEDGDGLVLLDELQSQVRQTEALAGAEAEKARRGIQRAVVDLNMDVTQLAYRLTH